VRRSARGRRVVGNVAIAIGASAAGQVSKPPDIRLHDLRKTYDAHLLAQLYHDVLEPSFSIEELDPIESIAEALSDTRDPETLAAVAVVGDTAIGGLVGEFYRRPAVLLIAYVAVRPDVRGRGVGSLLLSQVGPQWYRDLDVALAVAEVHDPRHYGTTEGPGAGERLRFYDRLGGRILGMPFVQPALGRDRRRVRHMLLLAVHVASSALASKGAEPSLDPARIRMFVSDYYASSEGRVPPEGDQQYRWLQSFLQQPIALLDVGRLHEVARASEHESA
jgi:GNAT superfamily N-acetyltransferase